MQKRRTLSRRVYYIAVPTLYCSRRDGRPWPKVTKSTSHFLEGGSADLLVTVAVATLEPLLAALGNGMERRERSKRREAVMVKVQGRIRDVPYSA